MCDTIRRNTELGISSTPDPDALCPICQERKERTLDKRSKTVTVKNIRLPGPLGWESGDREERIIDLATWLARVVDESEMLGGYFTREEIRDINLVARRLLRETMRL